MSRARVKPAPRQFIPARSTGFGAAEEGLEVDEVVAVDEVSADFVKSGKA